MSGAHSRARTERPTSVWKNALLSVRCPSVRWSFGCTHQHHAAATRSFPGPCIFCPPADIKVCFMRFYVKAHALTAYISISPTFYCPISMIYIALEFATARSEKRETRQTAEIRHPPAHATHTPTLFCKLFLRTATFHIQLLTLLRRFRIQLKEREEGLTNKSKIP